MRDTSTTEPAAIPTALPPDRLFRPADLSGLPFTTTREFPPAPVLAGQKHAEEAIRLGAGLAARGFNIWRHLMVPTASILPRPLVFAIE